MAPGANGPALDKVTLNGQDYPIRGPIQSEIVSEYQDGFKVGKISYDVRENAFFYVMDDFSNGFGHRRSDIREDTGYFWDSSKLQSPDLSRPGHVTLGPAKTVSTPTALSHAVNLTTLGANAKSLPTRQSMVLADGSYVVGVGAAIYRTTDGVTFTKVYDANVDTTFRAFAAYVETSGRVTYFAAFAGVRYVISSDGVSWANGAKTYEFQDLIFWDGKLLGIFVQTIIYATVTAGVELWNIDDPNDGVGIVGVLAINAATVADARFIGVATAPWGQPAVYYCDSTTFFVLDFYTRKSYPIDIGLANLRIRAVALYAGDFWLSDGWNIARYDPDGRTLTNVGFPHADGIPPSMLPGLNAGNRYQLTAFVPSEDVLFAVVSDDVGDLAWFQHKATGNGWSGIGDQIASTGTPTHLVYAFQGVFSGKRYLYACTILDSDQRTWSAITYQLAGSGHIPLVGTDPFGGSGANFTTGWIDGGFFDLYGPALRMYCDAWNLSLTSNIEVDYQLDNNENSSWVQMVNKAGNADVFATGSTLLYFPNPVDPLLGITFRTIRFRITLLRSAGTVTDSPELRALVFVYYKKPFIRMSWSFTVDVNRMIAEHLTLGEGTTPATMSTVIASLQNAQRSYPLVNFLPYSVLGIETVARVTVQSVKIQADNTRPDVGGVGIIQVVVIEPTSAFTT